MRPRKIIILVAVIGSCTFILWAFAVHSKKQSLQSQIRDFCPPMKEKSDAKGTPAPVSYPKRKNMEGCPPLYGKVTVLVVMSRRSYDRYYKVAQDTLKCYLRSTNYAFVLVDLDSDVRVNNACKHNDFFYKKHCAVATYLGDSDWTVVLDADVGVINPNHCIEEWIDPRVDIVFYERFFNWEIASGNYIVKNTPFAKDFVMKWANWLYHPQPAFNGADNGALQIHILETVLPEAKQEIQNCITIWRRATDYESYMAYVTCVKLYLGATRIWPGKLRILKRAHGWVRDGFLTTDKFCEFDFMLHGWKKQQIGDDGWESPYEKVPDLSKCHSGYDGWFWRNTSRITVGEVKRFLAGYEKSAASGYPAVARIIPYLSEPDVSLCFPYCDNETNLKPG